MGRGIRRVLTAIALLALPGMASAGDDDDSGKCARDSVRVGTACVDKYENSVWQIPSWQKGLIKKVKEGKATLRDLERGGATQVAPAGTCEATDYPSSFPENGNWTAPLYAVSIPGVLPSACLSWFQAVQACALSDKHLITNGKWQRAAAGTSDPGANDGLTNAKCNAFSAGFRKAGQAGATPGGADSCISNWGAQDMVGNLWEWTEQWVDPATRPACPG
jgi:formylglycine-generating enzyme required for sulfatase activity